jgi:hypothetical protein
MACGHCLYRPSPECLREIIQEMDRHSPYFLVFKEELSKRGYWQNLPRGDPAKGYQKSQRKVH